MIGSGKRAEILLVEDNPGDARLAQEAFRESERVNPIHIVRDGVAAMAFLHKEGHYKDAPRPDIILLDLNLPRKDGREVLTEIKGDADLKRIPVVILSSSCDEGDISKTYDLHANCYISKPVGLDEFLKAIRLLEAFWLGIAKLPDATPNAQQNAPGNDRRPQV